MPRQFSPYELNQLQKHHINPEKAQFLDDIPVEYITGHCDFLGFDFLVNKHTLIPRVETEEIIDIISKHLTGHSNPITIADIGTGSGCLGISSALNLSQENHTVNLYLSDISDEVLNLAKQNCQRLISDTNIKYQLLLSNLFGNYPTDFKADIILANLPYIPSQRIDTLDSSVKNFEPNSALDGGTDGAKIINQLLLELPIHCYPNTIAVLEIDHTHNEKNLKLPINFTFHFQTDQFGQNRFLVLKPN